MKLGVYLGAYKALHRGHLIKYQDINGKRDICGDMLYTNLNPYDYVIATPPCNYWSRARGNKISEYAKETAHLLPAIITRLIVNGKPFIVENVKNLKRDAAFGLLSIEEVNIYHIGRHTYWTNVNLCPDEIDQRQDFKTGGYVIKYNDMKDKDHQGGYNVHQVIEHFLSKIEA